MKRFLRLSACTAAVLAGVFASAPAAQADTVTTTATADYVCEQLEMKQFTPWSPTMAFGTSCIGPAIPSEGLSGWRTITDGTYVWRCYSWSDQGTFILGISCEFPP
ncbi:hypothetical protein [Streptomyces cavernae]|uniref:hypothetical protein n=1 Tax=Streptomyces cavernae TaxID=2259034 RepID=UPI000FEBA144|nr:hypothetical protein [Streptomyces cavernae]